MTNPCPHHSGIEAELKAIERRLELLEKLTLRIGALEIGSGYREGVRHWTDYLVMAVISGIIVLLARMLHL